MIRFETVTKTFKGEVVALREASAEIQRGEFVFLVGPSGSGKSTFIRLINREEVPDAGKILVAGKDVSSLSSWKVPYLRRNIGYVFQDYKLLPKKTVTENVAFALEVIGRPRPIIKRQVPAILELVGLSRKADRLPEELSGGEQQRVSIARAIVTKPAIILADEPTGELDSTNAKSIFGLFKDMVVEQGMTIIAATHDSSLLSMADEVKEIRNGGLYEVQSEDQRYR